ncbi:MAG: acyltransferase, partial [Acidimicrobiia bacterium]
PKVLMAAYCYLIGGGHDFSDPARSVLEQDRLQTGITLEEGVWLGAGAKVFDGVHLGRHVIVGAAAVVRESVPAHTIVAGVPAKIVGTRQS